MLQLQRLFSFIFLSKNIVFKWLIIICEYSHSALYYNSSEFFLLNGLILRILTRSITLTYFSTQEYHYIHLIMWFYFLFTIDSLNDFVILIIRKTISLNRSYNYHQSIITIQYRFTVYIIQHFLPYAYISSLIFNIHNNSYHTFFKITSNIYLYKE